jgi:hypothetical protein
MRKKLDKVQNGTTLVTSPGSETPIKSEDSAATTPGLAPRVLFIGVDGAARKAGIGVIFLSEDEQWTVTLATDTQSQNFYIELHAFALAVARRATDLTSVVTVCEVPPPGRFAHKIGASVNFANGKILGTLGCYFAAAGLPFPVVHIPVMPNQWRKSLIGGKIKGYDKNESVKYVRNNLSKEIADTKTIDEVEALCVAYYGVQQIYPASDGLAHVLNKAKNEVQNDQ